MFIFILIFYSVIFTLLTSCGKFERLYEDYGIRETSDLTLVCDRHIYGWEKEKCLACHNTGYIHQVNRIGSSYDGMLEKARNDVEEKGSDSCLDCHGGIKNNGIQ